jgi:hypothetical protein
VVLVPSSHPLYPYRSFPRSASSSPLKLEAAGSFETFPPIHHGTECHVHSHSRENITSHTVTDRAGVAVMLVLGSNVRRDTACPYSGFCGLPQAL